MLREDDPVGVSGCQHVCMATLASMAYTAASLAPAQITWTDVVSAISSAVAALFALAAVGVTIRFALRDYRDRTRALEVEQAQRISALVGPDPSRQRISLQIFNATGAPVYDVRAVFVEPGGDSDAPQVKVVLAVPGNSLPHETVLHTMTYDDRGGSTVVPRLLFRDSASRAWLRDEIGTLRRLERMPPAFDAGSLLKI